MDLISLVVLLIVIGVALYLIGMIPMDANIKQIIRVIVIVVVLLYILKALFGLNIPINLR